MIHQNNEIQEIKNMIENMFQCSLKNTTGIRANRKESYARRIFINLVRGYLYTPLKIIEVETGLSFGAINYHIREHKENIDKEYKDLYSSSLESFKKLFYRNLSPLEKVEYHKQKINNIINELDVKEFDLLETV